jgi:hypothetical protein
LVGDGLNGVNPILSAGLETPTGWLFSIALLSMNALELAVSFPSATFGPVTLIVVGPLPLKANTEPNATVPS